jgi:hypothetical protein
MTTINDLSTAVEQFAAAQGPAKQAALERLTEEINAAVGPIHIVGGETSAGWLGRLELAAFEFVRTGETEEGWGKLLEVERQAQEFIAAQSTKARLAAEVEEAHKNLDSLDVALGPLIAFLGRDYSIDQRVGDLVTRFIGLRGVLYDHDADRERLQDELAHANDEQATLLGEREKAFALLRRLLQGTYPDDLFPELKALLGVPAEED